jgi:hypothetical protein
MAEQPCCLYCEQTSDEMPLIRLTFQGKDLWICPQHLPLLIHEPAKLAGKLPGLKISGENPEPHHH